MSNKKARERAHEDLKRARLPGIITFLIAILSLVAFIWLNRKMAPPYPKQQTNSAPTSATNDSTTQR